MKKSFLSALVFFGTLIVLSVGYAAYSAMTPVISGDSLSATSWNALLANISDLNSRWARSGSNITFTGGNVGIGTISPGTTLEVVGDMKISGTITENRPLLVLDGNGTPCNGVGTKIADGASLLTTTNVYKKIQVGNIVWNGTTGGITLNETGVYRLYANYYIQGGQSPTYGVTGGRINYTINGVGVWIWQSLTISSDGGDSNEFVFRANTGDIINIISSPMPPLCFYWAHTYFSIERIR